MTFAQHLIGTVRSDMLEVWTLLALAALDFVLGTGLALAHKTFTSAAFRGTLSKLLSELGLPALVAVLSVVQPELTPVVLIALWIAIIAEATSIIEHLSGTKNQTAKLLLGLLKGWLPKLSAIEQEVKDSKPPTGGV